MLFACRPENVRHFWVESLYINSQLLDLAYTRTRDSEKDKLKQRVLCIRSVAFTMSTFLQRLQPMEIQVCPILDGLLAS
jgi:hypothetical protein